MSDALNQFVFHFALPAMLFVAVSRGSLTQILNIPFLATVVAGPLGATAFVLAQRYKVLELETSCSAVLSTALSVLSVLVVMAGLSAR